MSIEAPEAGGSAPPAQKPAPLFVSAGLFVIAAALVTAAFIVLGLLRPPETRTATLAPPGSVFYASVFVEPSMGQRRALDDLMERSRLRTVLPEGDVVARLMNQYLSTAGLDYERDVEPWLGREAGLSVSQGPEDELHVTAFFEAEDVPLAQEHLAAAPIEARDRSYEEIDYRVVRRERSEGGGRWAFGLVDDFLVVANPRGAFDAAVDAARGPSLAADGTFTGALDPLPDDRLVAAYISDPELITQLALPPAARAIATKLSGGQTAFTLSLQAESDALVLAASRGDPVRLEADVLASLIQNLSVGR